MWPAWVLLAMASQITSLTIVYFVYLTFYLGADQRKHQIAVSLAFVPGIHRLPVKSPHKGPVTRKMFPFDDVIMNMLSFIFLPYSKILMMSGLENGIPIRRGTKWHLISQVDHQK